MDLPKSWNETNVDPPEQLLLQVAAFVGIVFVECRALRSHLGVLWRALLQHIIIVRSGTSLHSDYGQGE